MKAERASFVDELRGLALLGIILVNAPFIGLPLNEARHSLQFPASDRVADFLMTAFFQGKFFLIFSFLFGYSIARFMRTDTAVGLRKYRRRLFGLAVFGLLHGAFFFIGDILFGYGLLGLILLLVINKSDQKVKRLAGLAGFVALLIFIGLAMMPAEDTSTADLIPFDQTMRIGSFWQTAQARIELFPFMQIFLGVMNYGYALTMMCLGLLGGRHLVLEEPDTHPELWQRCRLLGLFVGLPLALLAAIYGGWSWSPLLCFATAPLLSAGYVGWLVWLRERMPDMLRFVRASGQMSLTLYIGESALLSSFFCGWGLGWFGKMGSAAVCGVAIACWFLLELFAHLWLRRFRQGPLEAIMSAWTTR
jgi:uncharacterized protein